MFKVQRSPVLRSSHSRSISPATAEDGMFRAFTVVRQAWSNLVKPGQALSGTEPLGFLGFGLWTLDACSRFIGVGLSTPDFGPRTSHPRRLSALNGAQRRAYSRIKEQCPRVTNHALCKPCNPVTM